MNRTVDYRTDLYSLGVVFYEMLTGQLPFESDDLMQLVHSHIAKLPTNLTEINIKIPDVLSNVVLKLLSKNAENRYQSAFGLKHDLELILQNKNLTELGQNNNSGKLVINEKLYGRDDEINILLQCFDRVCQGSTELILIAGDSGVGKTVLVHEIHKPITEKRGIYLEGKFEQYQRNIPYFAIVQAFTEFSNILLKENDKKLNYWKHLIQNSVGTIGKVLTNLIPNLELVIGKQADLPELGGTEAKNRFNYVWLNFIKAISRTSHPLVLFIDNIQWADNASMDLLKSLLTDYEISNFLCITAYRDNEISVIHPIFEITKEKTKLNSQLIKIKELNYDNIASLLIDTLRHKSKMKINNLATLIYDRTQGNAFFTVLFLKSLYENNLLEFDFNKNSWEWDSVKIEKQNITDNVIEFMSNKVKKQAKQVQDILIIAACIGSRFDIKILSIIHNKSVDETKLDAARFHIEQKNIPNSKNYLQNALYYYNIWGAVAKIKQLTEEFPELKYQNKQTTFDETLTISSSETISAKSTIELSSIIKASRSLSSEVKWINC